MKTMAIERIEQHVADAKASKDPAVMPGRPERFTEAAQAGDVIAQGDLYLMIVDAVPAGYKRVSRPKAIDKQLVPGNTVGARHCLDSLSGVVIHRPENWTGDDLRGPCLVLTKEHTILHPTHGDVTIPAGFTVLCGYQPEFDAEERRERRARD